MKQQTKPADSLASVKQTLQLEAGALAALQQSMDGALGQAAAQVVERLAAVSGRVIVTGVGKSGHIARKLAATFASTGTPAQFVHAGEAAHGDLGMITAQDAILALSRSGESGELGDLTAYSRRFGIALIAITAKAGSALAQAADYVLCVPDSKEAGPIGLAPTSSTLVQLALGDALAIALLEKRGFTSDHFRAFHPGGQLGKQLQKIGEIMHTGSALPLCPPDMMVSEALVIMSAKGFGCIGVADKGGNLSGMITDGDLRRHMQEDLRERAAAGIMTKTPLTVDVDMLAGEALALMNDKRITSLFVVREGKIAGLVHIHDFLRLGLI